MVDFRSSFFFKYLFCILRRLFFKLLGEIGNRTQPSYLLSLLSTFYVMRSSPLWKDPVTLSWFQKTVESCAGGLDDS